MIVIGQYVRAVLAEGLAAMVPETEGFDPQLERLGVVTQVQSSKKTFVLEDIFGNEHICHLEGAVPAELAETDEFIRDWVAQRAAELGSLKEVA